MTSGARRVSYEPAQNNGAKTLTTEIRFDEWTFRKQPPELLRNGARMRLQEQPLQVLEELLSTPGELVTREHLIARLWPKRIVEFDAALNAAVRRLRAALGDEAETPRYIETVPRRGYRFIGTLQAASAVAPPVVEHAVMCPVPAPRTARGSRMMLAAAMAVLGVSFAAAWYWRAPDPSVSADTNVHAAVEPLQRARFFMQRRAPGDLALARQEFEQALSFDPNSAPAWVGLAGVHWLAAADGKESREAALPKVRDAAQRALALDPNLAEAHLRMAIYLAASGNRPAAIEHKAKAAALEPNNPLLLGFLASDAADEGRWDEAIALQRRAAAAEPLSTVAAANVAYYLFLAGRIDEAKEQFEKVLELDPTHPDEILALAQVLEGRYEDALGTVEKWPEGVARDQSLALIYHGLGRSAESDERLDSLIAAAGKSDPVRVAEVYAFRGQTEDAFEWLRTKSGTMPMGVNRLLYASPFLTPLHRDSRWAAVNGE
jgi:DNA-binding winged helix-turn-helix (wHTH) protein/tetratricopeptide (TPR) repeat protein